MLDKSIKNMTMDELFDEANRLLERSYLLVNEARARNQAFMSGAVGPPDEYPCGDCVDDYAGFPHDDVITFFPTDDGE